ncbi:hypothetical protein P8C59_001478 [Phyllachora maydis]|uniref:TAP42-like protein n=1 Tax=Phyllachora maydis TaxID=1825666 RepID=A0AAD9HYI7_9PEZI|nr:hypothetical protein P8C59_001478 [Phyllachora maydis]
MASAPEHRSLSQIFVATEQKRLALEGVYDVNSYHTQDILAEAIEGYKSCLRMIDSLGLFSPNETLDDIATSDLPYMLAEYYLAELTQKITSPSPQDRKKILRRARTAYEGYLHLVDRYEGLLERQPAHKRLLERYEDDPVSFSIVAAGGNPNAMRNSKIANFRVEKDLKARLEFLRGKPEYSAGIDGEGGGRGVDGTGGGDEEAVQAVHLAHIDYCTHRTFQGLESLNREEEVLAQAPEPLMPSATTVEEDDERRRQSGNEGSNGRAGYSERLDRPLRRLQSAVGGPILSKQGKPLQPFTLLNNRQEMARGVFGPGHNLPTMTIDEYLAEERRRGGIIEGGGEASGQVPEPDEDNIEKADAETMKAREWDEFVEANPKGAGNTLNRG